MIEERLGSPATYLTLRRLSNALNNHCEPPLSRYRRKQVNDPLRYGCCLLSSASAVVYREFVAIAVLKLRTFK